MTSKRKASTKKDVDDMDMYKRQKVSDSKETKLYQTQNKNQNDTGNSNMITNLENISLNHDSV